MWEEEDWWWISVWADPTGGFLDRIHVLKGIRISHNLFVIRLVKGRIG